MLYIDKMIGKPVDISPWGYAWRTDREVQEKPEAYFIPRRLERIDKVYRTAYYEMEPDQLKSKHYVMPDILEPLLPKPEGKLVAALLWTGRLNDYKVELVWPAGKVPSPKKVEVRTYPTSFSWFGWTSDKIMSSPVVSKDKRTWTYQSDTAAMMDAPYSNRVRAASEMVAVFSAEEIPVPAIRIVSPEVGIWQRTEVEVEWGFMPGKKKDLDVRLESYVAETGAITPLTDKKRKGIVFPVLYAPYSRPGLQSYVTVRTKSGGFTFRVTDLDKGPILIPREGVFITKSCCAESAREFIKDLELRRLKSLRQIIREHRECSSWEELMKEVRLWRCPWGTPTPPFPEVEDPGVQVEVPEKRWTDAWRTASDQLRGKHMWGGLAYEVGRVAQEMCLSGLYDHANKIFDNFLASPGVKSDGDFSSGEGSLEWAKEMRHDMGYSHDGTHASTGRMLIAMTEYYFLTGDKKWLKERSERMQKAADWIIRERRNYLKEAPNRSELLAAGMMPPELLGDYALPSSDWRWYYTVNALNLEGVQRLADALAEVGSEAAKKYQKEANAYRKDIRRVVDKEAIYSPVRLGWDGMYHTYIPREIYNRGLTNDEIGASQMPQTERFSGSLPLTEPSSALDPHDPRMTDTLEMLEEMGTPADIIIDNRTFRRCRVLSGEDTVFWHSYYMFPKATNNTSLFLLQDDVENFLRSWMNSYAQLVGSDGRFWEYLGMQQMYRYEPCGAPDNATAGWFLECFRNLLLMEENGSLWIGRAVPRVWLAQGKKIKVKNAPTWFGNLSYDMVSDVEKGRITATIQIPKRKQIENLIVRFRHPEAFPIKKVTVNGKPWKVFDPAKETITLTGFTGKIVVTAEYKAAAPTEAPKKKVTVRADHLAGNIATETEA